MAGVEAAGAGDAAYGGHPAGQGVRHGQGMRAAAGEPGHRESLNAQRVGELADIAGPVRQAPARLRR